ncbi:MAG: transposase [Synechococcaceae cyanobacterium SM2_3_60]|nr:transposase [Synechococcaceae cyanobacterium SM2_3_60]
MKTLKFKLYHHKRNRHLKRLINTAGVIWNHCIALHKRYYRLYGKHLNCNKLMAHIAKRCKRNLYWQQLGSQAVQDICQRIEKAYQQFFRDHKKGVRPPNFKKVKKYRSFTLKQAGYKFLEGNQIKIIGSRVYRYWQSRPIEGKVKTVTIKRSSLGELYLAVVVEAEQAEQIKVETGNSAGFDFGLRQFLTCSEGREHDVTSPQFLKQSLKRLKQANRSLSKKQKGSHNWHKARLHLARQHEAVVNRRQDWFWKLAHTLTDQFDVLCFESLNLKGMQKLWGRKVNDLAFASFISTLAWVAEKSGKRVVCIDRWYPSSKTCSQCGYVNQGLRLNDREWVCSGCGTHHTDHDRNASLNIKSVGASTVGLGDVSRACHAIAV